MKLGLILYTWFAPPDGGFIVFGTASLTPGAAGDSFKEIRGAFFFSKRQLRDLLGSCDRISRETASSQEATILAMEILGGGSIGGWLLPSESFLGEVEASACPEDSPQPALEIDQDSATLMLNILKSQELHLAEQAKYLIGFPRPWLHFAKYAIGGTAAILCHTDDDGSHLVFCSCISHVRQTFKEIRSMRTAAKNEYIDDLLRKTAMREHADRKREIRSGRIAELIGARETAIKREPGVVFRPK